MRSTSDQRDAMKDMFLEASKIYARYDIQLVDSGNRSASDMAEGSGPEVSVIDVDKKSMSMKDMVNLLGPAEGNEINVLFTNSISGCEGHAAGCSDYGSNSTLIGQNYFPWSRIAKTNMFPSGLTSTLAHEIGHQFRMSDIDKPDSSMFLMHKFWNKRYDVMIPGGEEYFLRTTMELP